MRVLIIDNNIDLMWWGSKNLRRMCEESYKIEPKLHGLEVHTRRGPQMDLPNSLNFDRIIISGSKTSCLDQSEWVSKLDHFLKRAIDKEIPILGVCYGHQTLARLFGGIETLAISNTPEIGWTEIESISDSFLFKGLPKRFYSYSSHFQEVIQEPKGFKTTCKSNRCAIQGFEHESKPIYTIQFHPEKDEVDAENVFIEVTQNMGAPKDAILGRNQTKKHFNASIGIKIFSNFLKHEK